MTASLLARIHESVHQVLDSYPGAWLVWCDPSGDWLPLLQRASQDPKFGGFTLASVADPVGGNLGGPVSRREIQSRLAAGESFVLHVAAPLDGLGWLWSQALLAERIHARTLREALVSWGWRPYRLTVGDDELAALARQIADKDPADWGGGGLQPDVAALLDVLAGGADPDPVTRPTLDLTIEMAGFPPLDAANLSVWRSRTLARLLVTQAAMVSSEVVPPTHDLLISPDQRAFALNLLDTWVDSLRLTKALPEAIVDADRIAALGPLAAHAAQNTGPLLSLAAESAVFDSTCSALAGRSGKNLLETIAASETKALRHAGGFWGDGRDHARAVPWKELLRLARAARLLLDASPKADWANPDDAVAWYIAGGWRLDRAGEEIIRTLDRSTAGLLTLVEPLRAAYRARWEATLLEWSGVWERAGCPVPTLPTAGEWAVGLLRNQRPTAILVVDALRYDLGADLAVRVNQTEGTTRATVAPARAPIPSITALGMGFALPMSESELTADVVEGAWQLRSGDINLSVAAQRRAWLQAHSGVSSDGFLPLGSVVSGEVPPPEPHRRRLVIADAAIDKLGHDDQLELRGASVALDQYGKAIAQLRDAGWLRILVVTDHGYIQWSTSEEKSIAAPLPDPVYVSRRAAAYPAGTIVAGPSVLAPGGRWRVAVPRGAASFRAYGGLGYFHGGASLQEWVIPCVTIEWPLGSRPVEVELLPLANVLGERPKVSLLIVRPNFLVEESIPRQVDIVIRDAQQNTILFRSKTISVTPDQERVSVAAPAVEGATALRGSALRVEVRDRRDDGVIASIDSVLMTELTGW